MKKKNSKIIYYLFDPEQVKSILKKYPLINQELPYKPHNEGIKTKNFLKARKSSLEIYRMLANKKFEILETLEYCLENCFNKLSIFEAKSQEQFESLLSEYLIAETFLKKGFSVISFERPDMIIISKDFSVSAEVYSPTEWRGVDLFEQELKYAIKNIDLPWDFNFEIRADVINNKDKSGKPLIFDHFKFSEANRNSINRQKNIDTLISQIKSCLNQQKRPEFYASLQLVNINAQVTAKVFNISKSQGIIPNRPDTRTGFKPGGYNPDHLFESKLQTDILNKIIKGQAQSISWASFTALIIDVTRVPWWEGTSFSIYLRNFGNILQGFLRNHHISLDIIIFCFARGKKRLKLPIPLFYKKKNVSNNVFYMLFNNIEVYTRISDEIFYND